MIIAHRGAHLNAPPNTIPAFEAAINLGCDSIETDVHFTRDNELVICHNSAIDRVSDGKGRIRSMTLDKLFDYDFGSYFSSDYVGTKIPTLHEFFKCVKPSAVRLINVEIKPEKGRRAEIVKKTIDEAKRCGVFDRLLISSFDHNALIEAKRLDENCKTAYIYPAIGEIARRWLMPPLRMARRIKVDYIHPHASYVNSAVVRLAHRAGIKVSVWTVNKPKKISSMIRLGVDGVITDNPEEMLDILKRYAK